MATGTEHPTLNGTASKASTKETDLDSLNLQLKQSKKYASFHGDALIGVSQSLPVHFYLLTNLITGFSAANWLFCKVDEWRG